MPRDPQPTDAELIALVRSGQREAYDLLYERHRAAASRVARLYTWDRAGTEDLVAESFTRVLAAIVRGEGPTEAFRPYLYTALRRTAFDWGDGQWRVRPMDDVSELVARGARLYDGWYLDPAEGVLERELAARAFEALPERWRMVLWHLEVEDESPGQIGPLLGLSAGAVSALAYRAREGLRQAYLQAHLAETEDRTCRPHVSQLGAYVRNGLGRRATAAMQRHLDGCASCSALHSELMRLNDSLGSLIAPLVFGAAAVKFIVSATSGTKPVGPHAAGAGLLESPALGPAAKVAGAGAQPLWTFRSMASRTMCVTTAGLGAATYLGMTLTPARTMGAVPFAGSPSNSPTMVAIGDTLGRQTDTIHVAMPWPGPNTTSDTSASQPVPPPVSTISQPRPPTEPTGPSQGESAGMSCHPAGTAGRHPTPMAMGAATSVVSRPLCQGLGLAFSATAPRILVLPPIVIPFVELAWKLLSSQSVPSIKLPITVPATSAAPTDALASVPGTPVLLNQMPLVVSPEPMAPTQVPTPVGSSAPFPNVDSPVAAIPSTPSPTTPSRTPPSPTTPSRTPPSPTTPSPSASPTTAPSPSAPSHALAPPAMTPPPVTPPAVTAPPVPQQAPMPVH